MNDRKEIRDRTWHETANRVAGVERIDPILNVYPGNEDAKVG